MSSTARSSLERDSSTACRPSRKSQRKEKAGRHSAQNDLAGVPFGKGRRLIRFISMGWFSLAVALLLVTGANSFAAQSGKKAANGSADEFFIISSVDPAKNQLLLKQPTEVTELVRVSDATTYVDKDGKTLKLADLRAGDTVYVTLNRAGAIPLASRVRKGPMTTEELRRRYLH